MPGNEALRHSRVPLSQCGFTLVELLLAIGISALVAALAYAGVTTAIGASEGMQAQVRQLGELQRTLGILEEDLLQVRPRAITNGYGSEEAAFRGGVYQDVLLEFTRGGLANPLLLSRSELQRVRYLLDNGKLWRQSWTVLDRADENRPPESVLLLEGVETVQLAFLAAATGSTAPDYYALTGSTSFWENDWNSRQIAADAVSPLPVAISITMNVAEFGEVRRVFELP